MEGSCYWLVAAALQAANPISISASPLLRIGDMLGEPGRSTNGTSCQNTAALK